MFQWVRCQLDHLYDLPSNGECRKALKDLPPTLPETYQRILMRTAQNASAPTLKCIERTIRWIALAEEPLYVQQISEAVSIEKAQKLLDRSNQVDMEKVLRHCSSLIRKFDNKLSFSHFSVKEYLRKIDPNHETTSRFRIDDHQDQEYLATTCLSYILLDSNIYLLEKVENTLQRISDINPIHMACILRLPTLVEHLIADGAEVDRPSQEISTPLMCAVGGPEFGNSRETENEILHNLLSRGVSIDPDLHDPLRIAIDDENIQLVSMLQKAGFSLRADFLRGTQSSHCTTPQECFSNELREDVEVLSNESFLFTGDSDSLTSLPINLQDQYEKLTRNAASYGQSLKVKDLIDRLPNLTGKSKVYFLSECLGDAAEQGHTETVAYLVDQNAGLAYKREDDQNTALHRAASQGRYDTVQWILHALRDTPGILDSENEDGMTPWMCAVLKGHLHIFQIFLQSHR